MDSLDEELLLEQAVSGDAEAFSALLEAYYTMIYRTAFKWVGNPHEAEDIAQEVCIKLGRAIREFRMDAKFSSWLYRVVVNTANDHMRKRRNHVALDVIADSTADYGGSAEEAAQATELWQTVRTLPDKQRDAVLLVYAEGLSHAEVALIMECKEGTVSWHIHEAKKQLKEWLGEDGR